MGNICCKPEKPNNLGEKINKYYDEDTSEDSLIYYENTNVYDTDKSVFIKTNMKNNT
jgi:hypothetical protein